MGEPGGSPTQDRKKGARGGNLVSPRERAEGERPSCREPLPKPVAAAVRVALGRADGHPLRAGDLLEAEVEGVLEHDDGRLRRCDLSETGAELGAQLGDLGGPAGSPSRASRRSSSSGSQRRATCRCATSRHALTVSRCNHVAKDDSPRNCDSFTHSFASASWEASRASSWSRRRWCARRSTRGACRSQSASNAFLSPSFALFTRIGSLSFS